MQQIARREVGVAAEAADGDAFHFFKTLDSLAGEDTIVHGVAETAEHREIQALQRRFDHYLRREHADLGVAGDQSRRRGTCALNKNKLALVAVLFEQLRFFGDPQRRELTDLARPDDVDVGGRSRHGVED